MPNSGYQYKYNGKEWQDELELNVYDYGNRNYDAALARYLNMDKFSEKYMPLSPYNYVANNPLKYIDIKGDSIMLIIGKPYTDIYGKEHPYGHVALRVYNSQEGYDNVYDFGRYGAVRGAFKQTGDGILNVWDNSEAYFKSEQEDRESVGFAEYSSVAEDKAIMAHFNSLISEGSVFRQNKDMTSYKLKDYDIFNNNCATVSCGGLATIGENWLGGEYDPREALKTLESNYKSLGLSKTVYKKGGVTVTVYDTADKPKKPSERTMEKKKEKKKIGHGDAGPADRNYPTGPKY